MSRTYSAECIIKYPITIVWFVHGLCPSLKYRHSPFTRYCNLNIDYHRPTQIDYHKSWSWKSMFSSSVVCGFCNLIAIFAIQKQSHKISIPTLDINIPCCAWLRVHLCRPCADCRVAPFPLSCTNARDTQQDSRASSWGVQLQQLRSFQRFYFAVLLIFLDKVNYQKVRKISYTFCNYLHFTN